MTAHVDAQLIVVVLVVASALFFVGRRAWRSIAAARAPKRGCGPDCGCG